MDTVENIKTHLAEGDLAYLDSFAGLVPCKVIKVDSPRHAQVQVTAARPGYRPGDVIKGTVNNIVPRNHIVRRRGLTKIFGGYDFEVAAS